MRHPMRQRFQYLVIQPERVGIEGHLQLRMPGFLNKLDRVRDARQERPLLGTTPVHRFQGQVHTVLCRVGEQFLEGVGQQRGA